MSDSVARNTRTDMTPTAGRFHPPSAPPSGRTTGRRGTTPRSATKTVGGGSSIPSPTKPKLTAEQQLDIIERLQTGNYTRGLGLQQFYDEITANNLKPKCRQNLYSSFAMVDPVATSTKNYGNGKIGSAESLSLCSSIISSAPSNAEVDATIHDIGSAEDNISDRKGYVVPDYIKAFHCLLSTKECYFRSMKKMATLKCKAQFASLLPQQKMETFLASLEHSQKIIQKFLDGNASDNMQLFLPSPSRKGPQTPVIHCDVENQAKVINSFHRLSEILDALEKFFEHDLKDLKMEAKLETFKDEVDKLEQLIIFQEQQGALMKDLLKKNAILCQDTVLSLDGIDVLEDASP